MATAEQMFNAQGGMYSHQGYSIAIGVCKICNTLCTVHNVTTTVYITVVCTRNSHQQYCHSVVEGTAYTIIDVHT